MDPRSCRKTQLAGAEYQPFPVRFMPVIVYMWPLSSSSLTLPGHKMNRNDLRRVDLNLLIVFETLMHERSVTRAAEKLFLGQPAISAALSRLRGLFDDPLFVRTGRSMEPTARAAEIFALLSPALDSISTAVSRASEFDPATSTAVFRIGLSDDAEFALMPPLLKRLRSEAPGIVLVVRRVNYILMPALLASGEISIGVSYTNDLPANAKRKVLRTSARVGIVRRGFERFH